MKISILCSDVQHPVNPYLRKWIDTHGTEHEIVLHKKISDLPTHGGDILFLISCSEIVPLAIRRKYFRTLVLHASDLPKGRGWSPHVWEISGGAEKITVCLLEAEDAVDSGKIWKKITLCIPKHALWNEINNILFDAEMALMDYAVQNLENSNIILLDPGAVGSYYQKRTPSDSEVNIDDTIANQFNKIRVCDPVRYPAFFVMHGKKYKLFLEKFDE